MPRLLLDKMQMGHGYQLDPGVTAIDDQEGTYIPDSDSGFDQPISSASSTASATVAPAVLSPVTSPSSSLPPYLANRSSFMPASATTSPTLTATDTTSSEVVSSDQPQAPAVPSGNVPSQAQALFSNLQNANPITMLLSGLVLGMFLTRKSS